MLRAAHDSDEGAQIATQSKGAEGADRRIFDEEIIRTLRTPRLCGEISFSPAIYHRPMCEGAFRSR